MPDLQIPSALLVVVLGLGASLAWGVADFAGGLLSRGAPLLGVLLGGQVGGLLVALPIWWLRGEPSMAPEHVVSALAAGAAGALGLSFLYRGLATGRMGIVAPVAGVLTAGIPVLFGILTQGAPAAIALVGIAIAALSVVLVSSGSDDGPGRPSGLLDAVLAGTCFGLFGVIVSGIPEGSVLTQLVLVRTSASLVVAAMILVRRQPWRVRRTLWPAVLGIGTMDGLATVAWLAAIGVGPLAIAASSASLYPVVTVILAALVLRERIRPVHAAGIVAAGAAIALITAGAAG